MNKMLRKTLDGKFIFEEHKELVCSKPIETKVPQKWVIVDTEDGRVYGFDEKGWNSPPIEVLKNAMNIIKIEMDIKEEDFGK